MPIGSCTSLNLFVFLFEKIVERKEGWENRININFYGYDLCTSRVPALMWVCSIIIVHISWKAYTTLVNNENDLKRSHLHWSSTNALFLNVWWRFDKKYSMKNHQNKRVYLRTRKWGTFWISSHLTIKLDWAKINLLSCSHSYIYLLLPFQNWCWLIVHGVRWATSKMCLSSENWHL